ncbi:MAG: hypothetical protein JNL21_31280 [Myxococcales bacterium]|nr:hypothetical protein [Myxococcales bacterium]
MTSFSQLRQTTRAASASLLALLAATSNAAAQPVPGDDPPPAEPAAPEPPPPPPAAPVPEPAPTAPAAAPAAPAPAAAPAAPAAPAAAAADDPERHKTSSEKWQLSGGRASFPLVDDLDPLVIEAHLQVFAQYVLGIRSEADETEWNHDFELSRGHAWLDAFFEGARARVMVEAVRSASEGALIGVSGDSFVMRMREAYAGYTAWDLIEGRVGLLPTMTIGPIEQMWGMRMVNAAGIERAGLASPADLGATLRGILPLHLGWLGVGAYNGEGYTRRELNRGKNIEVATSIHPLATVKGGEPLVIGGSYQSGSTGTGLARADRINASAGWEGDMFRGGAAFTYAIGVDGNSDRNGMVAEGFVRVMPIERLAIGADAMAFFRDTADYEDRVITITGAAGYFFIDAVGAFLAVDGQLFGEPTEQALPGQDDVRLRVIAAAGF